MTKQAPKSEQTPSCCRFRITIMIPLLRTNQHSRQHALNHHLHCQCSCRTRRRLRPSCLRSSLSLMTWHSMACGASQSPADFTKMPSDVLVLFSKPVTVGSQVEQSRIPSSSTVMPSFGGRFQLNTKVNSTTAATAFTPLINYEDMHGLVSSSLDDEDM